MRRSSTLGLILNFARASVRQDGAATAAARRVALRHKRALCKTPHNMTPPHAFDPTDAHYLREGTHARLYQRLGCHLDPASDGGARFAVWAPNAASVSVIGDWNGWQADADPLQRAGRRQRHVGRRRAGAKRGDAYKYRIVSAARRPRAGKGRPARALRRAAAGHGIAHLVARLRMARRRLDGQRAAPRNALDAPMSIYEMHLGSWRREDGQLARLPRAGARSWPTTWSTWASRTSS